ncbi:chaplin family protein [Streptomyces sp. NPDC037389]|uniref:chaplin family protein n=1 Tax=Streptomyces sp. NPDC037389 TaxID=3155369 RepID=UPI0033D229D5
MRQVTKKGLLSVAAASGVLAVTGGYAMADSGATGASAHSPGVASGNTVQVPVHVPVNACGNTVNVIGLLNPATGNRCFNGGGGHGHKGHGHGGSGHGGALAQGVSEDSPGVASGNTVQAPVSVPVNACGNSVDVVGIGNPATGNTCVNDGHGVPGDSGHDHKPPQGDHPGHPGHPGKPGHPGEHNPGGHHNPPTEHKPGHQPPAGEHHNGPGTHPQTSGEHHTKPAMEVKDAHRAPAVLAEHRPATVAQRAAELAHTGAGQLGAAGAASAGLLVGGAMLYRRSRGAQG